MSKFTVLLIFIWACINSAVCSSACPSPFTRLSSGHCTYWNASNRANWCQAAEFCLSIGGELAIDLGLIRAARTGLVTSRSYIGLNDLLIERGTNRIGWQLTNGSIAQLESADWEPYKPDNFDATDDFGIVSPPGVADTRFIYNYSFLCQPLVTPNSSWFRRTDFLHLGNISPNYCFTEVSNVKVKIECARRCAHRWQCRAAIYNKANGRCRMLDFTDASVGDAIETDPNWTKLVKVY